MTRHDPTPDFRALHQKGNPFVLANAWDIGSARMLQALGAPAIATSSAAQAFTLGRPDGGTITRDEALSHAADLVASVSVPVSGDFENGFGDAPETCAQTVRLAAEAGLAGICIEDTALPAQTSYDRELAVERIRAAAAAARALPRDFMLIARADGLMINQYDLPEAITRLQQFEAAGADGLYAPMPATLQDMARICDSVQAPVNVLAAGQFAHHSRAEFAAMGAARISLGSALARVTHQAILDAGHAMFDHGDFSPLTKAAPGDMIDGLLAAKTTAS